MDYGQMINAWMGNEMRPKWRDEFDMRIGEIELRTGLDRKQLQKVAEALEQLKIIRL